MSKKPNDDGVHAPVSKEPKEDFESGAGGASVGEDRGDERPIGVFDSGVGGLTVLDEMMTLLPQEHFIYFGDTARFPYGPRSIDEVTRFALQIMDYMVGQDVKMLVIACNSMTAAYEKSIRKSQVPVIGVIEPAVRAAVRATHNRKIGVLGTKATISSGEYERALQRTKSNVEIHAQICAGFVEHVEAGDTFSQELFGLAEEYLAPLLASGVDTLILGCTHYPLLRGVLHSVTRGEVELISSADEVAKDLYATLVELNLLRRVREVGTRRFIVSGDPEQFRKVGSRFLAGLSSVEGMAWPVREAVGGA
ncbi:MAG: glutamate racemase [Actinomycetota bacterium]|nr:glutamate racemase [Actinomycetota bacterium]